MFFIQVDKLTELNKVVFIVSADNPDTGAGGVISYHLISANDDDDNNAASTRRLDQHEVGHGRYLSIYLSIYI